MDGQETIHWFICDPVSTISRPVKELKHFEKQLIKTGETKTFRFDINLEKDLGFINEKGDRFLEAGDYYIMVKDKKVIVEVVD
jgi:beta-glucosidase